jgi:hypothetical protein
MSEQLITNELGTFHFSREREFSDMTKRYRPVYYLVGPDGHFYSQYDLDSMRRLIVRKFDAPSIAWVKRNMF